jgi:hypothetical protein
MNLFRRLFGKMGKEKSPDGGEESLRPIQFDQKDPMVIDIEGLSPEESQAVHAQIAKSTGFPIHKGRVEHAYSRNAVSRVEQCPRCKGQTRQESADFIYATDIAPRVMFAPAGFFCVDCPMVIIDEGMIASGMKRGFTFQGVVGIDHGRKKEPDLFRTWNGKKSVYVLDEDGKPLGISTHDEVDAYSGRARISGDQKSTAKRKRKRAKEDRKRNRRK